MDLDGTKYYSHKRAGVKIDRLLYFPMPVQVVVMILKVTLPRVTLATIKVILVFQVVTEIVVNR